MVSDKKSPTKSALALSILSSKRLKRNRVIVPGAVLLLASCLLPYAAAHNISYLTLQVFGPDGNKLPKSPQLPNLLQDVKLEDTSHGKKGMFWEDITRKINIKQRTSWILYSSILIGGFADEPLAESKNKFHKSGGLPTKGEWGKSGKKWDELGWSWVGRPGSPPSIDGDFTLKVIVTMDTPDPPTPSPVDPPVDPTPSTAEDPKSSEKRSSCIGLILSYLAVFIVGLAIGGLLAWRYTTVPNAPDPKPEGKADPKPEGKAEPEERQPQGRHSAVSEPRESECGSDDEMEGP